MPTYEYECEKCKYRFEKFQLITAPALKDCPKCSGRVKRLIGGGGAIIFKGSGFYKTDYRSDSYKKGAEAEKPKPEKTKEKKQETSHRSGSGQKPQNKS